MVQWRYGIIPVILATACRHPDRQSAVESSAAASERVGSSHAAGEPNRTNDCIVPMSESAASQADKADECPLASERAPTLPIGQVIFEDAAQKPRVQVELARTDSSRQRGLMYRTRLDENGGMLFSWDDDSPRTFWMHNTCIPLDMLFVASSGVISGVLEQVPVLNDQPRGVPCPVAHVLEVNAGWVRAHGVKPGQRLTISQP